MTKEQADKLLLYIAEIDKILKEHLALRKKKVNKFFEILNKPWIWFWAIVATVLILGGSLADLSWLGNVGGK